MKNNSFNQPYCSIITVSYKSQSDVEQLINSLFEGEEINKTFEVIVVSNSGDCLDLADKLAVQVVQSEGNVGFARGCNKGANLAKGKYLLFCNPDVRITSNDISKMCQTLDKDTSFGMLSPVFNPELFSASDKLVVEDNRVIGACLCVSSEIFTKIGRWDENFFLWGEDRDLGTRIRNIGLKVAFHSGILAKHLSGHSWKNSDAKTNQYLSKVWLCSQVYYNIKHRGLFGTYQYLTFDILKNIIRLVLRSSTNGRINDISTSISFGLELLFSLKIRKKVTFDGTKYLWEKK